MIAQRAADPRSRAIQVAFFAFVILAWWFVTARHLVRPIFCPRRATSLVRSAAILHSPTLPLDAFYTLGSFAVAYLLGGASASSSDTWSAGAAF